MGVVNLERNQIEVENVELEAEDYESDNEPGFHEKISPDLFKDDGEDNE
jgi:hypothetical protein